VNKLSGQCAATLLVASCSWYRPLGESCELARRQRASLPKEVPTLEGWHINPYYRPAREVGGDFYDFSELEDGRVGFAVGDATGKGVPAASVMSATCALLGGVTTASGASPGEVLARINEALLARIPPTCSLPASIAYSSLDLLLILVLSTKILSG
jgi:serine phosphatase RsbU (regulator of sigma subunit)